MLFKETKLTDKNELLEVTISTRNGYFSITGYLYSTEEVILTEEEEEAGVTQEDIKMITGGAIHDIILKNRPELRPFVSLHLADMDGVPLNKMTRQQFVKQYILHPNHYNRIKEADSENKLSSIYSELGVFNKWEEDAKKAKKLLKKMIDNQK